MTANNIQFTPIEIKIAKYIFKHCKERYNARLLARILNLNHAHANKLCNSLAGKRLLKKEAIGNAIYFTYDYESSPALRFMEYIISLEDLEHPKWLEVVAHSLKKFNEHIELSLIFGSSIRTKDFHDIDVLVIYDKKNIKRVKKIKDEIRRSGLIQQPIRYVDMTSNDVIKDKDNKIIYNMIADSLVSYNSEKYVEMINQCHKYSK